MRRDIIAFAGKMRSGKGEALDYINKRYYNNTAVIVNFADPLYKICGIIQQYCGFPVEKDRALLQYIGTDYGRKHDSNVWINRLFQDIDTLYSDVPVLIGDARFNNEFDSCKTRDIPLIKIHCDDNIRLLRGAEESNLHHSSELDMDLYNDFNYVVYNNSSLQKFHSDLDFVFETVVLNKIKPGYFV